MIPSQTLRHEACMKQLRILDIRFGYTRDYMNVRLWSNGVSRQSGDDMCQKWASVHFLSVLNKMVKWSSTAFILGTTSAATFHWQFISTVAVQFVSHQPIAVKVGEVLSFRKTAIWGHFYTPDSLSQFILVYHTFSRRLRRRRLYLFWAARVGVFSERQRSCSGTFTYLHNAGLGLSLYTS